VLIFILLEKFSDSQLTRKAPSSYSDGVYKMSGDNRPSARTISQVFMKGKDGMGSLRNRTGIATFFGKTSFYVLLKQDILLHIILKFTCGNQDDFIKKTICRLTNFDEIFWQKATKRRLVNG
jgi:dual oxidase